MFKVTSDTVFTTPVFNNVLIEVSDGAELRVDNGVFQHTLGTVIKSDGDVVLNTCMFTDNYSCISCKNNVTLSNCIFELGDVDYLDPRTVAFVECLNKLTVDYCVFNVNLITDSIGFGYLFFKLSSNGDVNSVSGANLNINQSFPVLKNTGEVNVETDRFTVHGKTNKVMVWTVENTNTVYSNDLEVEVNV